METPLKLMLKLTPFLQEGSYFKYHYTAVVRTVFRFCPLTQKIQV